MLRRKDERKRNIVIMTLINAYFKIRFRSVTWRKLD